MALLLNLTLKFYTLSGIALWIWQLCDTVYISLWNNTSLSEGCLVSLKSIPSLSHKHLYPSNDQTENLHLYVWECECTVCMYSSKCFYVCVLCVHIRVNVLTFTWQVSRRAERADATASGSPLVRGANAIGCFRTGRGGAFTTEGGAKTLHCHQHTRSILRVRKLKGTHTLHSFITQCFTGALSCLKLSGNQNIVGIFP